MGRFYFHLKQNNELLPDEEGIELPSVEAARTEALKTVRELVSQAITAGKPNVPEALVIADEAGRTLEIVPLASVLPKSLKK